MALYRLKADYFAELIKDKEFEKDSRRLYFSIRKIKYKNKILTVAVPLRSNINKNFQKNKNEYITNK